MQEEVTVMSVKGQVVIPNDIRKKLGLKPKDRLIVYGDEDMIVMKRLDLPELKDTWKRISKVIKERNGKYGRLSRNDISREMANYRKGR